MSIARIAHRMSMVGALLGRTWAGAAVRDSAIFDIDLPPPAEPTPFIAVYTDDQARNLRALDPSQPRDTLTIILELGVTAKVADGDWEIPATDAGMELILDGVERQIFAALANDASPWAEIWRRLHTDDPTVKSVRGSSVEKGIRFAGRQISIEVRPLPEPAFGLPASGAWAAFLGLAETDVRTAPIATKVRALIENDPATTPLGEVLRALSMTSADAEALLFNDATTLIGGVSGNAEPVS
jgi:hypothetical protein